MRWSGAALAFWCAVAMQAERAEAAGAMGLVVPVAGDQYRYELSTGEQVTLEVVSVRPRESQLLATMRETRMLPGGESRRATFEVIRTETSLAIDMPAPADNARLSPLVYFFAPANPEDTWLAQNGSFIDESGRHLTYRITARLEAIETIRSPAGIFEGCRRIAFSSTLDEGLPANRITRLTVWLHPEIGIVRSYSQTGSRTRLTELVQYRKLKGAPEAVR